MKQALHIFRKDVLSLRAEIAALMLAVACFAVLDLRRGPNGAVMLVMELLVGAAVWVLIARTVHEDGLPDDDEFWLTRPYERGSLIGAKILMTIVVVSLPLLVTDCLILATQSLSIAGNLPGLLLRHLFVSMWLILPPLAIASITRTMTQTFLVWLAAIAVAVLAWFPGATNVANNFRAVNEKYAISAALLLIVFAMWWQFSRRGTIASRVMIAAAILLPAPPFPEPAALAIQQLSNDQPNETARIAVSATAQNIAELPGSGYQGSKHCVNVPLAIQGVPSGWSVAVLSQNDGFAWEDRNWSSGWHRAATFANEFTRSGSIPVCANADTFRNTPATVHTSIALAVFAPGEPVRVRATLHPFEVPGVGKCQFVHDVFQQYVLACRAPVWLPPQGHIVVVGHEAASAEIAPARYPWTPFDLLPGLSPAYGWVTMSLDEGTPPGVRPARFGLLNLIADNGELEFRPRKQVTVLRREISVREVRFSNAR